MVNKAKEEKYQEGEHEQQCHMLCQDREEILGFSSMKDTDDLGKGLLVGIARVQSED